MVWYDSGVKSKRGLLRLIPFSFLWEKCHPKKKDLRINHVTVLELYDLPYSIVIVQELKKISSRTSSSLPYSIMVVQQQTIFRQRRDRLPRFLAGTQRENSSHQSLHTKVFTPLNECPQSLIHNSRTIIVCQHHVPHPYRRDCGDCTDADSTRT